MFRAARPPAQAAAAPAAIKVLYFSFLEMKINMIKLFKMAAAYFNRYANTTPETRMLKLLERATKLSQIADTDTTPYNIRAKALDQLQKLFCKNSPCQELAKITFCTLYKHIENNDSPLRKSAGNLLDIIYTDESHKRKSARPFYQLCHEARQTQQVASL
ncbi:MAG: hypothetical protein ABTQ34_00875 [Bdellovibrionales bacterium]